MAWGSLPLQGKAGDPVVPAHSFTTISLPSPRRGVVKVSLAGLFHRSGQAEDRWG